jgi:LacI family transcriptional regulator
MNLVSSPFVDLFYFDVTRGIVEASNNYDYNLILSHLVYEEDGRGHIPNSVRNKDADGIIFLQDMAESILLEAETLKIPFVLIDAESKAGDKYTSINLDSQRSAYVAAEYLIKSGHKNIGFITSSYLSRYYKQTTAGFEQAMADNGLPVRQSWVFADACDEQSAYKGMERILKSKNKPDAIVCAGDRYAIGAIKCAQDRGFRVPDDLSFIGMDNILLSSYITPPLTTIAYNTVEMGKMAVELLMKKISGKQVKSVIFPSENIIERGSVKKIQEKV